MRSKTKAFLLLINELNDCYKYNLKIINTFSSFLRLNYLNYVIFKQVLLFYSNNYLYKLYELPPLEKIVLIENISLKLE